MMLVLPSSQRTRYRGGRTCSTSSITPQARGLSNLLRLDHDPAPDCRFHLALLPTSASLRTVRSFDPISVHHVGRWRERKEEQPLAFLHRVLSL
jgi:hypothetical protein